MTEREYSDQSYYPSAKMRLSIRFEEFGQDTKLKKKVPEVPTKNMNGLTTKRTDLQVIADPNAPAGVKRFLLAPPGGVTANQTFAPGRSEDSLTFDVTVIPKDADWQQNGIRTADTLSASIRYIDCPIDPRLVRACAVEFFLGTVTSEEFAYGVEGKKRDNGDLFSLVPETYTDINGVSRTNLRFQGWVDKWKIDWTDDEPFIHIECRDNTQLLIEQEVPVSTPIDMKKPLDQAIADYLSNFVQYAGLTVEYLPAGEIAPVLGDSLENTATRPKLGPQPGKGGSGAGKLSVWDFLTDVCGSVGHAIRIEGTRIIIQTVRSFTTNSVVRRIDDPYQGRTINGESYNYRRFIYGRNLEEMRISRNYAKHAPTNVEVRSYKGSDKQMLVARFPGPADRIAYSLPGDGKTDQKWTVIRVTAGIKDPKILNIIAQTVYESLGRTEFSVELKTKNFSSFGGGNEDPDILDMKPGDTFELLVNKEIDSEEIATLTKIEKLIVSNNESQAFMKKRGFTDDFAKAYATANSDANFLTAFRLKSMSANWNADSGVTFSLNGMNYIEVRMDKFLPKGEEPSNSIQAATPGDKPNTTPALK